MPRRSSLTILPQPDDTACGPTCLHAVYRHLGDAIPLVRVLREVKRLPNGGTLGVHLANHALRRGYGARIDTWNLQLFDPTWFRPDVDLADRLRAQARVKRGRRIAEATEAYLEFLGLGGRVGFRPLDGRLIREHLRRGHPVLTGLSATYLYGCSRETDDAFDDVAGEPQGHFVVVTGWDRRRRRFHVADPLQDNPRYGRCDYAVRTERLVGAILLGIVTYDANLLVLEPPARDGAGEDACATS